MGIIMLAYNQATNFHTHYTPDCKIISHSHPYNDSKGNNRNSHTHSKIQFVNFDSLNNQFTVSAGLIDTDIIQSIIFSENVNIADNRLSTNEYLGFNHFRAPPSN
jgi:hypothetical protein